MKLTLTPEMIEKMSADEINAALREAFIYDDYKYQKENGILITEPYRAEGLDKILYKCPRCKAEKMFSSGAEIYCEACGKRWTQLENGELSANDGNTEFSHIPDWFSWEREEVLREITEGRYSFRAEVDVHSLPRCWKFEALGKAVLSHTREEGFTLSGIYNGKPYEIHRAPLETNSLHVEYDFPHIKPFDCIDLSTESDSFYCFPEERNVVTKLSLATEEIYKLTLAEKRK
jgi:hypothetical protein